MKKQFIQFLVRWCLNSLGLYVASLLLSGVQYQDDISVLIIAGLILSVVNALIKPFLVILALPAILITLGVFTIIINGFMVYLVDLLYSSFEVSTFTTAVLAGLAIGLVNYIITRVFDALAPEN